MTDVLLKRCQVVVPMTEIETTLHGVDILISGGVLREIGPSIHAPEAEVHDLSNALVTPGLINTHHHLYQTLTRAVPGAQDALLFGWLKRLYPIWSHFRPDDMRLSAMLGLAELALSGCTTSADHLYLYPNGTRLEDTIEGATEVGLRFHPTRGSMSIGESDGGLPPDALVEREADILEDCIRVVDAFHDPKPGAMVQVGLAPCSPFSVSRELMRDAALLARDKKVRLHTHLAENDEDVAYSLANFGCRPGQYAEDLGWVGDDVWHAHCVKLDIQEIDLFAKTGTGVAHCPCSNCRLGSGIAPVAALLNANVPVGLGVDGAASNDKSSLVEEARQAMLLQRVDSGAEAMSARQALWVATRGGAEVLGRTDVGQIAVGYRADLAVWPLDGLESAGVWDPSQLLLAGPSKVKDLWVEGRQIISNGAFTHLNVEALMAMQKSQIGRLMDEAGL